MGGGVDVFVFVGVGECVVSGFGRSVDVRMDGCGCGWVAFFSRLVF